MRTHYPVLIAGGGTAGITVAARLASQPTPPEMAIIEPSTKHYYQPLWTLVGAGVFPKEDSVRDEADFIPHGVDWIQDYVAAFDPDNNRVVLRSGTALTYDYLVVALGIQVDWDKIPGLQEALAMRNGVCSNYAYETVDRTWENIRTLKRGVAVFTQPSTTIKCGGAPQKIAYLADDHFRRAGVRDQITIKFFSGQASIFSVEKYANTLRQVCQRKGIETYFRHELTAIDPYRKEAVFKNLDTGEETVVHYDMLHATPPMSAPDVIKQSKLAAESGWVEVDHYTLQHVRYPNVFALGDCAGLPTSKTGAAIRKQAPVVVENLLAVRNGNLPTARYDGYTSCPLVTGYGSLVLAEFDYTHTPKETFPFDQSRERYSMYALKAYGLPAMCWNGMLRGRI